MWDVGDVGCSRCGMFRMWDIRDVGCSGCEMLGMCDVGDVGCSGYGMFGMFAGMWDIDLQNAFSLVFKMKPKHFFEMKTKRFSVLGRKPT